MQAVHKLKLALKVEKSHECGSRAPALTADEQQALIMQARDSARKMALRMLASYRFRMDNEEIQSLVDLSLCEAARRFCPKFGASFITFSFYYIKGNIVRVIDSAARNSKVAALKEEDTCEDQRESFSDEGPCDLLEKKELSGVVSKAFTELSDQQRAIIEAIFFQDLNATLVAKKMRLSRGHISRLKSAALKTIQRQLQMGERSNDSPVND